MAGDSSEVAASVHKVLSNDDLLMEILLRLPILSLHLFKPVCKQWLSHITSPSFTLRRIRIPTVDPPSGLFIERWSFGPGHNDFVSFDPRIPAKRSILFPFSLKGGIKQSCNGLLLCYDSHGNYIIYNPLINMFKMLPPKHDLNYERWGIDYMNLAFDPTKSPCYKVVHVGSTDDFPYSIIIQTYSSETGVWSVWHDRFRSSSFDDFFNGIYWNGAIHWLSYGAEHIHVKLDILDRPVLTNIKTPLPHTVKIFKSHGSLLLLCKDYDHSRHLNIYEMKNGYSEWSVKYFVNLDDMMRPYPTWRMPPADWGCHHIRSIVLGELDEDSFMVIVLSGKVLQCSFLLGTVSEVFDLGKRINGCRCIDYVASFAHV